MLRVVEPRRSRVRVCAEVVYVEAFVDADHVGNSVSHVVIKRASIGVATYGATSI